jgi:hypothetical protein
MSVSQLPKVPGAGTNAREQADAYDSMFASISLRLDDETVLSIPPHPSLGMLDDDQQEAYEELMFEIESYDRGPDVEFNGKTFPGELKTPYRKDGVLIKPPHRTRVVQVALGETVYKQLLAGGRNAVDVWRCWHEQTQRITDRQASDSKSS